MVTKVARRIREQRWGEDVLLIALTGWGQDAATQHAAEAGFDHHVTKLVDPTVLAELLEGTQAAVLAAS
jgi:CheY-like chemotaxis protein